jgi:FkbM family methyltransferase
VLAPRTAWRRHKYGPQLDPLSRAMLERHYYAGPMIDFFGASAATPDLLVAADLGSGSVVVDAGAFVGEWATQICERHPDATVHAFEPAPGMFEQLDGAVGDHPLVHTHEYGLGAADAELRLALDGPGSSVFTPGEGAMGSVTVTIRDVAATFDELGLDRIDLLKLNIEGGEYDVLDRLDRTGWLARIDQVLVQFHEWHPHAHRRRRANRAALRRDHVEEWNYPWVWERWRLRVR